MGPRYGIHTDQALGVAMKDMKALAKELGRDHGLAAALWATGGYEARTVAALIDEPALVDGDQMDALGRGLRQLGHLRHGLLQPVRPHGRGLEPRSTRGPSTIASS